jgi:hypothetical protein
VIDDAGAATGPRDAGDLDQLDRVLDDAGAGRSTRRRMLEGAAAGLAAAGVLGLPSAAAASGDGADHTALRRISSALATSESLAVTFLTEAIARAPGTPSAQFTEVLRAAITAEFDHLTALEEHLDGKPLTLRFWIPDAAFGAGGAGLFASIEAVENIEISGYLAGVSTFARATRARQARIMAEALGVESEHRVLARSARSALGQAVGVPDDRSFALYDLRTPGAVVRALEALGVGLGRQGAQPGRFYDFPGDPVAAGVGLAISSRVPQ